MQCVQCQHENASDAKFCNQCAAPFARVCAACGHKNTADAKFCNQCATPLIVPHSSSASVQSNQHEAASERRLHALLPAVTGWLQRDGRVTYRTLKYLLGLDEALLEAIREELRLRRLAIAEEGKVLVWIGETALHAPPTPEALVPLPNAQCHRLAAPAEDALVEALSDAPILAPEPMRSAPEAERRQLTVMFCDLADSTTLSQQLDPEDLRAVVCAYQATATAVIQQYQGHIAQYLGDGLLMYFGWPVAHEDDAQRAAHAGLGIIEAVTADLNPRLAQQHGVQLTVRLGVHTGPVVVGEMGGGGRQESLATGETVNIAARLEGLAVPNTLVMSQITARLVQVAFRLEDLGPQVLKGVAEPMSVYRVHGPMAPHEAETVAGPPFLVGRDEEVGLLLRRWEQSKNGRGQVVWVSGEAGIGKSSLVAMAHHQVMQEGYTRITFRCSPYHTNSALYPVMEHAHRLLQFQPADTPATRLDKLERLLSAYSRPLDEAVPLYAAWLSVPVPEGRYPALHLSPQQQRQHTQDALVGWLLEEAERQPTLAVWEDLHWADPSTLELLGLILDQTPTVPMLHVLTFRPAFEPPWPMRSHVTPIALNRLERPQVEALIARQASGRALPAEVIEHIVSKTDGVPLYVEELTKTLLESDLLQEHDDRVVLTGPLHAMAIPDTLQDALMARLDQLGAAKEVAQMGSVLGREFAYDMLRAITSEDDADLQTRLAQLVEAELLYQRGRPPRSMYMFKHALIQDAAYASLLKSTRQHIHRRIADSLETTFHTLTTTHPELVAHHYMEAGCYPQAVAYWYHAGCRASQQLAHAEAIAHLTKSLEVLRNLPETDERHRQELDTQLALGRGLLTMKGLGAADAERPYRRTLELCQRIEAPAQQLAALAGLRRLASARGDIQAARDVAEQLLGLAQRQQDTPLLLEALYSLGIALKQFGEFGAALTQFEQGIALDQHPGLDTPTNLPWVGQDPSVGIRTHAGGMLWLLGYPDQAVQQDREALTLAEHRAYPYSQTFALFWSATLHAYMREGQISQRHAEAGIALATTHAFAGYVAWGMVLCGWARGIQGHYAAGVAQIQQGISSVESLGQINYRAYYLYLLADIYGHAGQPEEGLRAIDEALATMETAGDQHCKAEVYRLQGELLQRVEDRAQRADLTPEACFQQALAIARQQQAKSFELRAATSLARLWQQQDKRREAYDLLAPVYGWFTEGFDTADLKDAKGLLDELSAESRPPTR